MKIAEELRPDGSTRYRVQHKDIARPGRYTTRRFDEERDAKEFVRRAKLELVDAIAWADEAKGGVSFRGQAGRTFSAYALAFIDAQTDMKAANRKKMISRLRQIERVESFAEMPMGAITHTDLERLKRGLDALRTPRGESLKSRTKNTFLELAFSVVRRAAVVGDIPRDVTVGVQKFRVDDAKQTCPITVPEFESILAHVAPSRRVLFRLLLDSGLRISEALSLTWNDFHELPHGIYEITVWELDAQAGKTRSAQRVTTIPVETFKRLERDENAAPGALVFPLSYDTWSSEWRRAVQRAQTPAHATEFPVLMKTPTIHDLRHSHASFLIVNCGMNLALVAERLGHRDIGITQRYYGRLVKEQAHELGALVARSIPRGVYM